MKNAIKPYFQPAFLICVVILAVAGAGKKAAIGWMDWKLEKVAIPLRKSLDDMDFSVLAPYELIKTVKIENKKIEEALGTKDYLECELMDTEADEFAPERYCHLFITYYTGDPDRVPHIPEECHAGSGNRLIVQDVITLNISKPAPEGGGIDGTENEQKMSLDVRYIVFKQEDANAWYGSSKYSVLYFFKTNGVYASTRTQTRMILGRNFLSKYSYFSKVEMKFYGRSSGNFIYPDKAEAIKAGEKLLSVLLPVMEWEHWPDWEKANSEDGQ